MGKMYGFLMGLGFEDKDNRRDFSERREKSKTYTDNNSMQKEALKYHICGKMGHTTTANRGLEMSYLW